MSRLTEVCEDVRRSLGELGPTDMVKTSATEYLFGDWVERAFDEAMDLLLTKHNDYGPKNISNAPGGPELGLLVRLSDKLARLEHLRQKGGEPNHEAIRDTWLDIANYGIIGLLVHDHKWPR